MTVLNGMDVAKLTELTAAVRADPGRAERTPHLVAEWLGEDRSRVRVADKVLAT